MNAHRKNPNPKKQKKQKKNKFLLGIISLAVTTLASCSSWGLPDPDGLRIPNWGKSTTVAPENSSFNATAMDADGNIIAVGSQSKNGIYGYGDGVTATGAYTGGENALIVKYNALNGKTLWAKSTTTASDNSTFNAVASDKDGNIIAVGSQRKSGVYGYGNGVTTSGACSVGTSCPNAVLVKYNSEGQALWARSTVTAPRYSGFQGVATDQKGNIYVVGYQNQNGTFGYGNGVTTSGAYGFGSAADNAIIIKYNSEGQALWARSTVTAPSISHFMGVATDRFGNVYVVGYQKNNGVFGYGNGVTVSGSSTGDNNAVIVKYNSNGQALWANSVVGAGEPSQFSGVTTDKYGDVYVVGKQLKKNNIAFDYGNGVKVDSAFKGSSYPVSNGVIIKYSSSGQAQWGKSTVVATNASEFSAVATTFAGDIYTVGSQNGASEFDWGNNAKVKGTSSASNFLVVSYDTHGKTKWAKVVKAPSSGSNWSSAYGITAGNHKLFVVGSQKKNGEFNYGNGAGDIKGAYAGGNNAVITTFGH